MYYTFLKILFLVSVPTEFSRIKVYKIISEKVFVAFFASLYLLHWSL